MMRFLDTRAHVAMGLVALTTTVLLLAAFIGLVPDREAAVRAGRVALAEAIAANGTAFVADRDLRRLEATLALAVQRNAELRSAAVRRADGEVVVTAGEHLSQWTLKRDDPSTDTQLQLPLHAGGMRWGQLELRFAPRADGWAARLLADPWARLIAFVAATLFVLFYAYLAKVLRHLDPSQAVPARVRAALDTLAEGLVVIDRRQYIVLANAAFAKLLGESPERLVGRHVDELGWLGEQGRRMAREHLPWHRALLEARVVQQTSLRLVATDGVEHSFLSNCSPIMAGAAGASGALVSFQDITELEANRMALEKAKASADAANEAKSRFLANMSHEIRTPMNAILGFTELLRRGYVRGTQDTRRHLETIHTSGKHLLGLINDILDLSKVEAGRLTVELLPCEVHAVVRDVVHTLAERAAHKNLRLEWRATSALPDHIDTDASRLQQILTNLVGNAIKFTSAGTVTVSIRLGTRGSEQIEIDVADTGIGMTDAQLATVFDAFVQADASITRRFGGTGLGLSISRNLARALGGDITVKSTYGRGSVFTVTLPTGALDGHRLLSPEAVALATPSSTSIPREGDWSFPPSRILVVDDGAENRELLAVVLGERGLVVEEAENGRRAVERVAAGGIDLVLMDVQMPVMDGHAATLEIRARGLALPVVALSADAMKGAEEQLLAAGCTAYLTKPIDLDVLLATLGTLLGGKRGADTPVSGASAGASSASVEAMADTTPIVSRLAARPRLQEVIRKFGSRLHDQLEAMEGALNACDHDSVARLAHWLKGAGGTVGFDVFTEPAAELERHALAHDVAAAKHALDGLRQLECRLVLPGPPATTASSASAVGEAT